MFSTSARSGSSPLAAGATIPLAFIATGLLGGVAGTLWLVLAPGLLTLPHLHPHVVALAHVWLLGALLTVCFGAVYQLLPVLANTAFTGRALAWLHLGLHAAGVTLMVHAFVAGDFGLVALGGTAVGAGVVLFCINVGRTLRAAVRLDAILIAFGCAAAWLGATVVAGVLLALNLRFGWWSMDVLALLRAHAHLGVAGFFVTLLQGAMFRLVPMFTLAEVRDLRGIGRALGFSQAGLLLLTPGLAWHSHAAELGGAALLLASFALSAVELRRVLATRKKRVFEPGLRGFFLGLALLGLAALGGAALAVGAGDLRAALAYGVVAVFGGVLASVEGMLCKIVPFLVWMRVYGPRVGRQRTPVAAALGRASLERAWVWAHGGAVALLAVGALIGSAPVLGLGAAIFAVGQAALFTSLATTARHLWQPIEPAPATAPLAKGIT